MVTCNPCSYPTLLTWTPDPCPIQYLDPNVEIYCQVLDAVIWLKASDTQSHSIYEVTICRQQHRAPVTRVIGLEESMQKVSRLRAGDKATAYSFQELTTRNPDALEPWDRLGW